VKPPLLSISDDLPYCSYSSESSRVHGARSSTAAQRTNQPNGGVPCPAGSMRQRPAGPSTRNSRIRPSPAPNLAGKILVAEIPSLPAWPGSGESTPMPGHRGFWGLVGPGGAQRGQVQGGSAGAGAKKPAASGSRPHLHPSGQVPKWPAPVTGRSGQVRWGHWQVGYSPVFLLVGA
jgi:hypothetical protein